MILAKRKGGGFTSSKVSSGSRSSKSSPSAPSLSGKELAQQVASLERQINDANSEARKAPLIAKLNALKSGASASFSAQPAALAAKAVGSSFVPAPAAVVGDKELSQQIASLERQIKDANSEARKAPLIAKLTALRSGSSASFSAQPISVPATKPVASSVYHAPFIGDKELAAKIASLEKQIKDANSEARKAPLIAQLNALKSTNSITLLSLSSAPSAPPPPTQRWV